MSKFPGMLTAALALLAAGGCADGNHRQAENGIGGTGRSPGVEAPGGTLPGELRTPPQVLPATGENQGPPPPSVPDTPSTGQPPGVMVPPNTTLPDTPGTSTPGNAGPAALPGTIPGSGPGN